MAERGRWDELRQGLLNNPQSSAGEELFVTAGEREAPRFICEFLFERERFLIETNAWMAFKISVEHYVFFSLKQHRLLGISLVYKLVNQLEEPYFEGLQAMMAEQPQLFLQRSFFGRDVSMMLSFRFGIPHASTEKDIFGRGCEWFAARQTRHFLWNKK